MPHYLFCLLLFAVGLAPAMTPDEFNTLCEKPGKTAADCYKLYEAFRDGDGTAQDDARARQWVLAAHGAGMMAARHDIATLPWRAASPHKPCLAVAEVDDATASALGRELLSLLVAHYGFTGGVSLRQRAADEATLSEVRRLIAAGADLNLWAADEMRAQHSALSLACMHQDYALARLLLEHGADPSANGNLALVASFLSDVFEELHRYGDIEVPTVNGIHVARRTPRRKTREERQKLRQREAEAQALFDFLLAAGAAPQLNTHHGWSLMYHAASNYSSLGVEMLRRAGLDPMRPQNPHEYVQAAGRAQEMDHHYHVGHVAHRGTPLHFATENVFPSVVEALLLAGADANARDHEGKTPLDIAQEDIAEMQAKLGSNPNAPSFLRKCRQIADFLQRAGGRTSAKD